MNVSELVASLPKRSKKDFIPGTVKKEVTGKLCPSCGLEMAELKPCCGSPHGMLACRCGYKINKER